jgi:hypothetical protein
MASEASPLENELVAMVESHPEIFSPQDIVNMRRKIIFSFGMVAAPKGVVTEYTEVIGLSGIATAILIHVSNDANKKTINTSQDIPDVLNKFEFCVEFLNKFLTKLCATERDWHFGGGYNSSPTPKIYCETMKQCIIPHSIDHYTGHGVPNVFELVKKKINEYQSLVLKLWTDALILEGKITPTAIDEMQAAVSETDGYKRKMRELYAECNERGFKPNLDESMLLKWLALFHVAKIEQMTKTYVNLGSLDLIIAGIISQFMPIQNVHGYSYIPQSNKHNSELNIMHLKCKVIYKNYKDSMTIQPPVMAYLSSDILDQCVQSVGHFPTADQFILFLRKQMIEKAASFAVPPPSAAPPPASAPPLNELDGGKKTKRRMIKKRNHFKKSRHHRR